jgi:hypothetical protein
MNTRRVERWGQVSSTWYVILRSEFENCIDERFPFHVNASRRTSGRLRPSEWSAYVLTEREIDNDDGDRGQPDNRTGQ